MAHPTVEAMLGCQRGGIMGIWRRRARAGVLAEMERWLLEGGATQVGVLDRAGGSLAARSSVQRFTSAPQGAPSLGMRAR